MTQADLAARLGVDQSTISLLEKPPAEPKATLAEAIRALTDGDVVWPPREATVEANESDEAEG